MLNENKRMYHCSLVFLPERITLIMEKSYAHLNGRMEDFKIRELVKFLLK